MEAAIRCGKVKASMARESSLLWHVEIRPSLLGRKERDTASKLRLIRFRSDASRSLAPSLALRLSTAQQALSCNLYVCVIIVDTQNDVVSQRLCISPHRENATGECGMTRLYPPPFSIPSQGSLGGGGGKKLYPAIKKFQNLLWISLSLSFPCLL